MSWKRGRANSFRGSHRVFWSWFHYRFLCLGPQDQTSLFLARFLCTFYRIESQQYHPHWEHASDMQVNGSGLFWNLLLMKLLDSNLFTLVKWILDFLGIRGVNFDNNSDWEFLTNSGSKNLEIPRNSKFIASRTWNSNSEHQWLSLRGCKSKNLLEIPRNFQEFQGMLKNY